MEAGFSENLLLITVLKKLVAEELIYKIKMSVNMAFASVSACTLAETAEPDSWTRVCISQQGLGSAVSCLKVLCHFHTFLLSPERNSSKTLPSFCLTKVDQNPPNISKT